MSKQHLPQDRAATEQHEHAHAQSGSQPAAAMVRAMIAKGQLDPQAIASIISAHPAAGKEIMALLHGTVGNQFASQVTSLLGADAPLGPGRSVVSFDQGSEMREDRATIDHPHTSAEPEKQASTWITRAQQYNSAHPENVLLFLGATGEECADESGGADPRKVARWQADHGISPDGRIGEQTVTAAFSA
jgi:hypothetical protein